MPGAATIPGLVEWTLARGSSHFRHRFLILWMRCYCLQSLPWSLHALYGDQKTSAIRLINWCLGWLCWGIRNLDQKKRIWWFFVLTILFILCQPWCKVPLCPWKWASQTPNVWLGYGCCRFFMCFYLIWDYALLLRQYYFKPSWQLDTDLFFFWQHF